MYEVSPFWVWAMGVTRSVDLWSLRTHYGNWNALESAGAIELEAAGVPEAIAQRRTNQGSLQTRGIPVTMGSRFYPARLRNIRNAPAVFFVEGDPTLLDARFSRRVCAVVGTRAASPESRWLAGRIAHGLAAGGHVVVSGLALGIDAAAHQASAAVGQTVAVLGHGLNYTAPRQHSFLRKNILQSGGALVTTWEDDVPPRPFRFPLRNRWIAGLQTVWSLLGLLAKWGDSYRTCWIRVWP